MKKILLIVCTFFLFACNNSSENKIAQKDSTNTDKDWTLRPFIKLDSVNPVLVPGSGSFVCPL